MRLAPISARRWYVPERALCTFRVDYFRAVCDVCEGDTHTIGQDVVRQTRRARILIAHNTVLKRRVARRTLSVLGKVPGKALNTPNVAADLNSTPDNLVLGAAHTMNAHEVLFVASNARLAVPTCLTLGHALEACLLVPVEALVADAAPPVGRKDTALPGERPVAVARVARQERPFLRVARHTERCVERACRTRPVARCR